MAGTSPLQTLIDAGIRCLEKGAYRAARKSLSQAVRKDPHHVPAQFWLGVTLYHLGRCKEAEEHLEWVRKKATPPVKKRPAAVFEYLARCHMTSDSEKALELAQEGLKKDPDDARIRFVAGTALIRLRRRDEAWHHFKMAYRLETRSTPASPAFPRSPGLVPYALSDVLVDMKRWKDAREVIDEALRREPGNAQYHNRRGVILYEGMGEPEAALKAVDEAIRLDPGTQATGFDGVYHYNRALYLKALKRYPEAIEAVEGAIRISPQQTYKALRAELMEAASQRGQGVSFQWSVTRETTSKQEVPQDGPPQKASSPGDSPLTFSDVGGMRALKEQMRRILAVIHTNREEAGRYGIRRNGILLHGPPGCGKTFFARAVAGEFGLNFFNVPLGAAQTMYVGGAGQAVAQLFQAARDRTPCLLFFDEFDAVAGKRKDAGTPLEAQMVNALLQQIDAHRDLPGMVLMAATNRLEEIDPAAIREGRFDYKIRIPKPDFDARREILQVLLADRPHDPDLDVTQLAQDMEGFTAAQVRNVVDEAAMSAWEADARIAEGHLEEALLRIVRARTYGGRKMGWDQLILPQETKQRLQFIEQYLEHPELARKLAVRMPTGLLLHGPPGTGKTTIARVLATETDASFFAINASDIFSKWFGESEQKVKDLFQRARDAVPSILFIDEADAVLSRRGGAGDGGQAARNSVLNTFLAEMDGMDSNGRLFVIAATNRPELVDEAVLRPGRLSEAVEIGLPIPEARLALLELFTREMPLEAGVDLGSLAERTEGASGADLEGLCTSAGRNAFLREMAEQDDEHLVAAADFEKALEDLFPSDAWAGDQRRIGF